MNDNDHLVVNLDSLRPVGLNAYKLSYIAPIGVRAIGGET